MSYTAFFDLDNTILKLNSGEALMSRAYKNGILSTRRLIYANCMGMLYRFHLIDPLKIINKFSRWLVKSTVSDFEYLCDELVEKDLVPAIRPEIIDEIKIHSVKGANLVILSSAISSICSRLAKHLDINTVICSELEEVDQHYTGRFIGKFCYKDEKLRRMNQYLQNTNCTKEDSYYYGDSIDDLPVLQSVGYPICVNPDRSLKKIAIKRNWAIHKWD